MQVTSIEEPSNYALVGGGEKHAFGVSDSAHFFTILSDSMYQDKPLAVVRETICNALDAHIVAGKQDVPIEVTITDTELKVRDFGSGIPHDQIKQRYCTYGGTTKSTDDRQTGGFGIGCKAPFAVTEHFTVENAHNGVKSIYEMTKVGDDGKPVCNTMVSAPTTDTGLTVTIPIADRKVHKAIDGAVRRFSVACGSPVNVNGVPVKVNDYTELRKVGYGMYKGAHTICASYSYERVFVLYGHVVYPVTSHPLLDKELGALQGMIVAPGGNPTAILLYAPPSSLTPMPSREQIGYSALSVKTLNRLMRKARHEISAKIGRARHALLRERLATFTRRNYAELVWKISKTRGIGAFPNRPPTPAIGADAIARVIAYEHFVGAGRASIRWLTAYAAGYFRAHRGSLKYCITDRAIARSSSLVDILVREQVQLLLKQVMRAVTPVLTHRPTIRFKGFGSAGLLKRFDYPHEPVSGVGRPATLIIAPSTRAASECNARTAIALIDKSLTAEQIEQIKTRAATFGFNVVVSDAYANPPARKPRKRSKAIATVDDLFTGIDLSDPRKGEHSLFFAPIPNSVRDPIAFVPLLSARRRIKIAARSVDVGPDMEPSYRFVSTFPASQITSFISKHFKKERLAYPASKSERDRLIARGVPSLAEYLLTQLRERLDPADPDSPFIFASAFGRMNESLRYNSSDVELLAYTMIDMGRREACAALLHPYTASDKLDEAYNLCLVAARFFGHSGTASLFDGGDADVYRECRQEFRGLIDTLTEQTVPGEMAQFYKRLRDRRLTPQDVAHLSFLASLKPEIRGLPPAFKRRFIELVEEEGKRFLGSDTSFAQPITLKEAA